MSLVFFREIGLEEGKLLMDIEEVYSQRDYIDHCKQELQVVRYSPE